MKHKEKLPKQSHLFCHTYILVQQKRSVSEQNWHDWHVYQLLFEVWFLASCKKKYEVCRSPKNTTHSLWMFLNFRHQYSCCRIFFCTFSKLFYSISWQLNSFQIHPSVRAQNSLPYLFVNYEKKYININRQVSFIFFLWF